MEKKEKEEIEKLQKEKKLINARINYIKKKQKKYDKTVSIISYHLNDIFNVDPSEIFTNRRYEEFSNIRYWFCYIMRSLWHSYANIGNIIGMSHCSIMYRCKICKKMMDNDSVFKSNIDKCIDNIRNELIW